MITGERMAAVDANATALGVSTRQLMESSGHALARAVRSVAEPGDAITVVAGRGNNGGDAFVAVRFLEDFDVETILLGRPETIRTDVASENWATLERCGYETTIVSDASEFDLPACDVVVDGMLGTGVSGELREPEATVARAISDSSAIVVSVDVPSGLDTSSGDLAATAVEADHVVTFHDEKPGLDSLEASITVADIGIPRAAETRVGPGDRRQLADDERTARVYVVGGGPFAGAPALAAQAALRAGAELAFVATPSSVADAIQGYEPDLIVQPYDGTSLADADVSALVETAHSYDDVVVLGPGLGTDSDTLEAARAFLEDFDGPAVVDADALRVVTDCDTDATLVCTPNSTELAHLGVPDAGDPGEVIEDIERAAVELGAVILAKGPTDVVTDGERTRTNPRGTPGMAVGGTGDVLAGVVASLLDRADPLEAAAVGAYVASLAGESMAETHGSGFTASHQLEAIPRALWGEIDAE